MLLLMNHVKLNYNVISNICISIENTKFWFHNNFEHVNTNIFKNLKFLYFKLKNKFFEKLNIFSFLTITSKWRLSDFFWKCHTSEQIDTYFEKKKIPIIWKLSCIMHLSRISCYTYYLHRIKNLFQNINKKRIKIE